MMASRCTACLAKGIATAGAALHASGLQLCQWHGDAIPDSGETTPRMRFIYGPPITAGAAAFRAAYGTDEELLQLQEQMLRGEA